MWRTAGGQTTIWIGGIYEVRVGSKTLCHVFAGGQRIATFEPINPACAWMYQDGLPGRCYRFAAAAFDWPLREGRTPYTVMLIPLLGVLCVSVVSRRRVFNREWARISANRYRSCRAGGLACRRIRVYSCSSWLQAVSVVLVVSLFFSTTTMVEAVTCDPVFWYYHTDHLGSSNVMTDRAGNLARHYEHGAFGTSRYADATCTFNPSNRYTGQILDDDTGLYYYNTRYYDPELGRFIQADTIVPSPGDPQSFNRYSYCVNNPLKYVDPSGHAGWWTSTWKQLSSGLSSAMKLVQNLTRSIVFGVATVAAGVLAAVGNIVSSVAIGLGGMIGGRFGSSLIRAGARINTFLGPFARTGSLKLSDFNITTFGYGHSPNATTAGIGFGASGTLEGGRVNIESLGGRKPTTEEAEDLHSFFPNLNVDDVRITGEPTRTFNCIAWTLGITDEWVWPAEQGQNATIVDFDSLYAQYGYKPVSQEDAEIALFGNAFGPQHAAIRLIGDWYESKLGEGWKIIHNLNQLEGGSIYGNVIKFYGW